MAPFDDGVLISLVRQHPFLWNKNHPLYKDETTGEQYWSFISNQLSTSVEACKTRWLSIRARFAKERRFNKKQPSYEITWPHYEACLFLDDVILTRKRNSTKSGNNSNHHRLNDTVKVFVNVDESSNDQSEQQSNNGVVDLDSSDIEINFPQSPCVIDSPKRQLNSQNTDLNNVSSNDFINNGTNYSNNYSANSTTNEMMPVLCALNESCRVLNKVSKRMVDVPKDVDSTEWYFAKSLAQSLSGIPNKRTRMKLKAKILQLLAEEGDWGDE